MSDLQAYISKRKIEDPEFTDGFEEGYQKFKIGVMLHTEREQADLTQQEVADKLNPHKSAISLIENHCEDIRLSTLEKYAEAFDKTLNIQLMAKQAV